jgi:two-component system phosphate regulon sensor histidine kinase PhoR
MATNQDSEDFPTSAGWFDRLREAWRALFGPAHLGPQGGVVATVGGRIAAPAQVLALIESLIAGLPNPAIVLDREGRVIAFNAGASAIAPALRHGEPALISLRMPELVDAIRRASKRREPQRVEFFERVPHDRWFEAFVTPVRLANVGEAASDMLVLTFNDLTPLRRVEEMRADFIANASHELRTPLAALLGFIETLQGRAKDDPAAREKFLAIMQGQASRMARLIDDLLSLSRIELNAHLQPETPVDLKSIVRQVADGLQTLARDRDVEIKVSVTGEPLTVLGDRDELIRALENLVENALKYGAAGKRVDITLTRGQTRAGAPEARLSVRDYGPGIAPEHLPRLTERFYRVDVVESRAQGGTGLGLALVKHVLNRHGGRLTIESTLGAGASFTMHVPLTAEPSPISSENQIKSGI